MKPESSDGAMPALSAGIDGYVRLPLPQLALLSLTPICVDVDDAILSEIWDLKIAALRAGYCEWAETHLWAAVTLGWSWFVDIQNTMRIVPDSITSNLMITSIEGYDLGPLDSKTCIQNWIATLDWPTRVTALIQGRNL